MSGMGGVAWRATKCRDVRGRGAVARVAALMAVLSSVFVALVFPVGANAAIELSFHHVHAGGTYCLDLLEGNVVYDGDPVHLWTCNYTNDQRWWYNSTAHTLETADNTRYCLDANYPVRLGSYDRVWQCNGGANQKWEVAGNIGEPQEIYSLGYPYCVTVAEWSALDDRAGLTVDNGKCEDQSMALWAPEGMY